MASNSPMPRRDRLRRVVILCCSFARNLAYYRVGWSKEHRHLIDPAKSASANFWRAVNGNFMDMCVLEWCKLSGDQRGKYYWGKIVTDSANFEAGLLRCLRLDERAFQKEVAVVREYRDKFVAHLDSEYGGVYPKLDVPKKAVWFYHAQIVNHEAKSGDLEGLQVELNRGYKETRDEAKAVYGQKT